MLDLYCRKKFAFINYHRKKFLKEKRHFPFRPEVEIKISKLAVLKKHWTFLTDENMHSGRDEKFSKNMP